MNIYGRQSNRTLKDVNIQKATCFGLKTRHSQALQRTFQAKQMIYVRTYIVYVLPEMLFVRPVDDYF
jgi:hypothetical protein